MIITLDGPGGAGKSTAARLLARRLGLPYLNSGFIYRAVTLLALEERIDFEDRGRVEALLCALRLRFQETEAATRVFVTVGGGPEREITGRLKDPDVTAQVYRIANDAHYRRLLVDLQRRCAEPDGVVAEGRDMGSVIFPGADVKFYVDASPEVRAGRQHRDLLARGFERPFEETLAEVMARDAHDRDRPVAPLCVPEGATVVLTDDRPIEDVLKMLLARVAAARDVGVAGNGARLPGEGGPAA